MAREFLEFKATPTDVFGRVPVKDAYAELARQVGYYDRRDEHWVRWNCNVLLGIAEQEPGAPAPTSIEVDFDRVLKLANRRRAVLVSNGPVNPQFGGVDYDRGLWHIGYCVIEHLEISRYFPASRELVSQLEAIITDHPRFNGPTDLVILAERVGDLPLDDLRRLPNLQIDTVRTLRTDLLPNR